MSAPALARTLVVGGAGFIGGHVVETLLQDPATSRVTVFDNFSSGRRWHLEPVADDPRLQVVVGEVSDLDLLTRAAEGHQTVVHLASNSDIARAATEPSVDFNQGTLLTHHVAEAARGSGIELVLYASGSGVYGDLGELEAQEDHGPLLPVSTYGASKLAGEALLCSYAAMFGMRAQCFRFANVVGPRQTHGVGYDFVRRLLADPTSLRILGDGRQSKSYIHVEDVIQGLLTAAGAAVADFEVYNVATEEYVTVTEIAELAVEVVGLPAGSTRLDYTGGDRGWKGDVPVVRLSSDRIRALGWKNERTSREALRDSMSAMAVHAQAGRLLS